MSTRGEAGCGAPAHIVEPGTAGGGKGYWRAASTRGSLRSALREGAFLVFRQGPDVPEPHFCRLPTSVSAIGSFLVVANDKGRLSIVLDVIMECLGNTI